MSSPVNNSNSNSDAINAYYTDAAAELSTTTTTAQQKLTSALPPPDDSVEIDNENSAQAARRNLKGLNNRI